MENIIRSPLLRLEGYDKKSNTGNMLSRDGVFPHGAVEIKERSD